MLARFLLPLLTIVTAACGDDSAASAPPPAGGTAGLENRLAAADASGRVLVIDFFTTWCGPCKKLDRETWSDSRVKAWFAENGELWKVDAEAEPALASRFRVEAYPTIVLLKGDGTEIDRLTGFRNAEQFLEEANSALEGKTSLDRAHDALKGREEDPMARGKLARELARNGRYEEALGHYLWCFDHGAEASPSYSGVRVSFLLSDIQRLGERYPPALEALRVRRDAAEAHVEELDPDSPEASAAAWDACGLNEAFGEPKRMLAVYDRFQARNPETKVAATLRVRLVEQLADARRYGEVLKSCDNRADRMVGFQLEMFGGTERLAKGGGAQAGVPDIGALERTYAVQRAALYYEAELGAGSPDKAREIANTLIAFDKSGATFAELMQRAQRAGKTDVVQELAASAEKELAGAELELARKAAKAASTQR